MKNVNLLGRLVANCCSLVLFLLLSISFSATAQQKVVGGVDVDIKDYPWQVALTSSPSGSGFCGGSIIGDSWVLTAAHCVNGTSASGLYIRVGSSAPFAQGGDSYSVSQIISHPSYSGNSYDFALVEIEGTFSYNENVAAIDLVSQSDIDAGVQDGGVMSTITGWGTTSSGGSLSSTLQMVQAPLVENNVACGSANDSNGNSGDYGCSQLDETMICAGDLVDGGEDACQGDSGGPLAVRNAADTKWLLIGATSWGYGCADVNYPGVWSKVSYVLDWIDNNAEINSENGCMDANACNYDAEAIYDDGSCAELDECGDCGGNGPAAGYDCEGNCTTGETLVVTMSDSYGDGWNGNNIVINGVSSTFEDGSEATETLCYDAAEGCVLVTCGGGSYESEVSWSIADGNGNVLLTGGAPFDGGFGDCNFPVPGCIDSLASNYNPAANEDDGSCIYPLNCDGLTYVTIDVTEGIYPSEVSWSIEATTFIGTTGSTEACLEDGCYTFTMSDSYGDGWNGSIATITTDDGYELLNGTLESGDSGILSFGLSYDGECGPVYGCMDSIALNYNPAATANDNSCLYPTVGCTDSLALNYNELATEDDGSCAYPIDCTDLTYVNIEVGGGSWTSEVSWEMNGNVGEAGSSELCLEDGCYVFNMYDSYGDGWNGNTVTITTADGYELLNGTLESGSEGVLSFALSYDGDCGPVYGCTDSLALNFDPLATATDNSCLYPTLGCTDSLALNYNELATEDDGSCVYPIDCTDASAYSLMMYDSYGDGWNNVMFAVSSNGEEVFSTTLEEGSEGSAEFCLNDGCYMISVYDGYYQSEVSWNLLSEEGEMILSGGAPAELSLAVNFDGDCGPVYGCTDSLALNFDPLATATDNSCLYPTLGCTDSLALNYNELATEDDGSCTYPVDCSDLTYVTIEVGGGSWAYEVSWEMNGLQGEAGSAEACLEDGCYIFNMYDSFGDGWNGNTVTIFAGNDILLSGTLDEGSEGVLSFSLNYDGECGPVYGCTDSLALNFDPLATANDNSCLYPTLGCTDSLALNYNELATVDDGSCTYPMDCEGLTTIMIEVGGGSYDSEISWELNGLEGVTGSTEYCLETGCYTFNMYDSWGDGWNGATVSVTTTDGEALLSGTLEAGTSGTLFFSYNSDCGYVNGCTDSLALNFDPTATIEDGSCEYEQGACDDGSILDCNGNCAPEYWLGDGYCDDGSYASGGVDIYFNCEEFGFDGGDCDGGSDSTFVSGCTDSLALNFNPTATIDDGSCEYEQGSCDSYTVMMTMNDSYGDGWNGSEYVISSNGVEVATGTFTSGYDATDNLCLDAACYTISVSEGSYPSEVSWSLSLYSGDILEALTYGTTGDVDFGVNTADCSETIWVYGCTDVDAINFNELATADDGSCEYETECNGFVATLNVNSVSFGTEHSWSIADANGTELYSGGQYANNSVNVIDLCLDADASYVMTIVDTYGDGWNGGTFSIAASYCDLVSGGLEQGQNATFEFTASCDGGSTGDAPWDFDITGSNHTIVIDGEATIDLNDMPIEIGDALGVFFTDDNGDLQCGGFAYWTGSTNSIAAQGDDTTTDEVDGFTTGSSFIWMIWDASEDMVYAANAEYSADMPNQGEYTTNGISALAALATMPAVSEQVISMPSGWSIFSTYMVAENMDMADVLAPIYDDLVIAKNNAGLAYLPEWNFNGVGDLELGQAYQIKLNNANDLTVVGTYSAPEENPIALTAGWNMIGYLRIESADAAAVLSEINATGNLVIAKDYNGQAYLPEWDFNGIGDMKPGEGYQLKINNDDVLTYLSNDDSYRLVTTEVTNNSPVYFESVAATDNNMTIVIEDAAWDVLPAEASEIAAYDKAGNLIGSARYTSPVTVLTVWGDDATTTSKDGLVVSEIVSFKVWSANETQTFEVSKWIEGSSAYTVDAINVASSISTINTATQVLSNNRELVRVLNVLGQEVTVQDAFKGEVLFNVYNDGTVEKVVK